MIVGIAIASFVVFVAAFQASGLVVRAQGVLATTRAAMQIIASENFDDDEKERQVRIASGRLLAAFFGIALRTGVVLAAPAAILWGADFFGLAPSAAVMTFLLTWPAMLGFLLLAVLVFAVLPRG